MREAEEQKQRDSLFDKVLQLGLHRLLRGLDHFLCKHRRPDLLQCAVGTCAHNAPPLPDVTAHVGCKEEVEKEGQTGRLTPCASKMLASFSENLFKHSCEARRLTSDADFFYQLPVHSCAARCVSARRYPPTSIILSLEHWWPSSRRPLTKLLLLWQ